MKKIITLLSISLFLATMSCTKKQSAQNIVFDYTQDSLKVKTDSISIELEDSLLNMILDIPEIKEYSKSLEKETAGEHGAAAFVNPPKNTDTRYIVNVGLNADDRFNTVYVFYIDKATREISVLHQASGRDYPLKEWQNRHKRYLHGDKGAFPTK